VLDFLVLFGVLQHGFAVFVALDLRFEVDGVLAGRGEGEPIGQVLTLCSYSLVSDFGKRGICSSFGHLVMNSDIKIIGRNAERKTLISFLASFAVISLLVRCGSSDKICKSVERCKC
jgi:hypothetical protein